MKNKILQLFILGCNGDNLNQNPNLKYCLKSDLGGVIFFTHNILSKKQFKGFVSDIKNLCSSKIFLSIDQEGGRVERTENIYGGKKYKSAKFIVQEGIEQLKIQTEKIAQELKEFGLNMNFAPVCDVNSNPDNPIIGERAFSNNPEIVSKCAKIVSEIYLQHGIISVAKHFPGHGDTNTDSHVSMPVVDIPLTEFENTHVKPFIDNINVPAIMVSHVWYKMFDKTPVPASLSKNIIENYLIRNLNYQGIVISDDMVMGAVNGLDPVESIIKGVEAGECMFIYRNSNDETIDIIEQAAKECKNSRFLSDKIDIISDKIYGIKKLCYY